MLENRMEIMWGIPLLDEGFTSIPNLIIRNYRKLGLEHGEFGFICQLLTYKHDARDPFPSRATLSEHMCCSERQIDKWVKSLRDKGLIRTGRRRNVHDKKWDNTVYNFKPLLDAVYRLIGENSLPDVQTEYEIVWDDGPHVPQVRVGSVPEVRMGSVPEVRTKKKSKNNNIKDDCMIDRASAESAAARSEYTIPLESENLEPVQDEIYEALQKYAPSTCYIANNIPMSESLILETRSMLGKRFPSQLSPEVVRIACDLYLERACNTTLSGVTMRIQVDKPVGFFESCYRDAIKHYKLSRNKRNRFRANGQASLVTTYES